MEHEQKYESLYNLITLGPDWHKAYTIENAVADLKGFKYKGPGWYFTKTDILLVFPCKGYGGKIPEDAYWFFCWNNRNPMEIIGELVGSLLNVPVRVDTRE